MDNPLQRWVLNFNCFLATIRFYNSLTKCNSLLLKKVLHTDNSLSSRTDSCWTSHLLSALDGLAHSDLMRRQVMAGDPVNLSQFVEDLSSGHLGYWNQYTIPAPRVSKKRREKKRKEKKRKDYASQKAACIKERSPN
eukprot:1161109-Pelagomonas_calceolata.AAC.2